MSPDKVLFVQQTESEFILLSEAFKEAPGANKISVVRADEQAIKFLDAGTTFKEVSGSDLFLPGMYHPRIDGKEFLPCIKNHSEFKRIPATMLPKFRSQRDVLEIYNYHANSYISKPVELDTFLEVEKNIENLRIPIVDLPKTNQHGV